jgi:hypothetical protein
MKANKIIANWLESYGDIEIEEKIENIILISEIRRIVKEYPNDMELGKRVRQLINKTI